MQEFGSFEEAVTKSFRARPKIEAVVITAFIDKVLAVDSTGGRAKRIINHALGDWHVGSDKGARQLLTCMRDALR